MYYGLIFFKLSAILALHAVELRLNVNNLYIKQYFLYCFGYFN